MNENKKDLLNILNNVVVDNDYKKVYYSSEEMRENLKNNIDEILLLLEIFKENVDYEKLKKIRDFFIEC